jgi:ABC-type antimicrobial peptide transport system permease subunit
MALGARPWQVVHLLVGAALKLALTGAGLGLLVAVGLARTVAGFLYGTAVANVVTFAAAAVTLTAVALFASYGAARRAARVDPLRVLKSE